MNIISKKIEFSQYKCGKKIKNVDNFSERQVRVRKNRFIVDKTYVKYYNITHRNSKQSNVWVTM